MNELRTEAKMALANYERSYGAFGKEAFFSMDNVDVVQDYIDQLEADADKFANEIERLRTALRFYADMENYIQVDQSTVFVPIITVDLQPQLDNGRTARAALGEA